MKRQWLVAQIILAVTLVGIAVAMFAIWPNSPRWRVPREEVLGFDEQRQLLLTINRSSELSAWDLESGRKKYSPPCQTKQVGWIGLGRSGLLSPDAKYLVLEKNISRVVEIIQLVDGKVAHKFSLEDNQGGFLDAFGFSKDGRLFAASTFYRAWVWDVQTGTLLHSFDLALGPLFINGIFCPRPDAIQFSADNRSLAVSNAVDKVSVFDLQSDQMIGKCTEKGLPHFLSDNTLAVFGTDNVFYMSNLALHYYRIENKQLQKMNRTSVSFSNRDRLVMNNAEEFATARGVGVLVWNYPEWLPDSCKNFLNTYFGINNVEWKLSIFDTATGALKNELSFGADELSNHSLSRGFLEPASFQVFQSRSKPLLAVEDHDGVAVLDVPARRSLVCYITTTGISVVALWLARPRRLKAS